MDFAFSEEQLALRDVARDVFSKESPPSRIREMWDGAEPGRDVWRKVAEVGIAGLLVEGGDLVDLALVCEEAGRAALPEPLVDTVAVVAPLAPPDVGARISSGDALATVVFSDAPYAPWGADADVVLFEVDGRLHLTDDFDASPVAGLDPSRRLATVQPRGGADVGSREDAWVRGAVATANVLNGVGLRLLETTVRYVSEREQFGRPVGSFQAVKHKLASVHVMLECSRSAAWFAAYALANDEPDAAVAASVAKAYANETAALANAEALQCHGGIGFTWEHDLHVWLKRGKALEAAYGSARDHRRRLEGAVFDG